MRLAIRPRRRPSADLEGDVLVDPEQRPATVTLGLLLAYVEGAAFLAIGTRNPEGRSGAEGAAGLGFILLGVLVLGLTTLTRTGSRLARACLVVPLVAAAVVIVRSTDFAGVWRGLAVAGAAAVVVLLTLVPPSRRFFGDDGTTLGTP